MGKLDQLVIPAWALPLLVIAIVVPAAAGFAIAGPPLGLAIGAVTVAALLVIAARARYDKPIEVAPSPDRRYRMLVVATESVDDPATIEQIAAIAAEGQKVVDPAAGPEVVVLTPALQSTLDRWASDVRKARRRARAAIAASLGAFAVAGIDAAGKVGDGNPVQAVEDELHTFPAREVIVVDGPGLGASEVAELRRRLDRPVRELDPSEPT
jgi:hypothetical protein